MDFTLWISQVYLLSAILVLLSFFPTEANQIPYFLLSGVCATHTLHCPAHTHLF